VLSPDRGLRLEDVAALVGSPRATLYYYFSGRDDLAGFLLEQHLGAAGDAIRTAVEPAQPPADRLRAALAALVAYLGERPGVLAGLLSFAGHPERSRDIHAQKEAMLATPLRAILEEGAASGAFAVDDTRDAAHAILGAVMVATLARWHEGRDTTSSEFQHSLVAQLTRSVGCGLLTLGQGSPAQPG
jgi:AcrR family transcriptional regulator